MPALLPAGFGHIAYLGVLLVVGGLYLRSVRRRHGSLDEAFSGCLAQAALVILVIPWLVWITYRTADGGMSGMWISLAMAAASAVLMTFGARRLYAFRIRALMRERADPDRSRPERAPEPTGVEAPVDPVTPTTLGWRIFDERAVNLVDTEAERGFRDIVFNRPGRVFFRGVVIALLVNLIMIGIQPFGEAMDLFSTHLAAGEALPIVCMRTLASGVFVMAFLSSGSFIVALIVITVLYRRSHGIGLIAALVAGGLTNLFAVLMLGATDARGEAVLEPGQVILPALCFLGILMIASVAALVRHTVARRRLGTFAPPRLLVLRVFGKHRQTQSFFRHFGRRWQFVGPAITIMDPTYAAFEFGRALFTLLGVALLPVLAMLAIVAFDPVAAAQIVSGMLLMCGFPIYVLLFVAYLACKLVTLPGQFSRDAEGMRRRIRAAGRIGLGLPRRYRQARLCCHDDLWRGALDDLLAWSDVVVMDLRGFSESNRGCAYEIGCLLGRVPLDRIVFIVDRSTDASALRALIEDRWRHVTPDSPNLAAVEPAVTVYVCRDGASTRGDVWPLVALLADVTIAALARPAVGSDPT
ncbi:MAG: hypothetical protein KDA25_04890 [Phycisphaerales bacterium]|nr:hypothetical protein [Phycisphaerales bacterium]